MTAIREITKVKPDRTVEVSTPALQPGEEVEVIVLAGASKASPPLSGRPRRVSVALEKHGKFTCLKTDVPVPDEAIAEAVRAHREEQSR